MSLTSNVVCLFVQLVTPYHVTHLQRCFFVQLVTPYHVTRLQCCLFVQLVTPYRHSLATLFLCSARNSVSCHSLAMFVCSARNSVSCHSLATLFVCSARNSVSCHSLATLFVFSAPNSVSCHSLATLFLCSARNSVSCHSLATLFLCSARNSVSCHSLAMSQGNVTVWTHPYYVTFVCGLILVRRGGGCTIDASQIGFKRCENEDFLTKQNDEVVPQPQPLTYLLTPWSRVLLEKLTSKRCR